MQKSKKGRLNLHEALERGTYDHGVICTYTFNPDFFEKYCLEKFDTLNRNANLTVITDRGTYEKSILGPEVDRPKLANLRYLFIPISVPGVFHSKLFLFASKNKGKLLIGSANFTKPGLTSNAELIGCYEYSTGNGDFHKSLFCSAINFILKINKRWPNEALSSNLREMIDDVPWLYPGNNKENLDNYYMLDNLDNSLWEQIIQGVKKPVDRIRIVSRYFDREPDILERIIRDLRPRSIEVYTQNGITTLGKNWVNNSLFKKGILRIFLCTYTDQDIVQPLHAKAISIEKNSKCVFAFGSANFTIPAMLESAKEGNLESILLVRNLDKKNLGLDFFFDPNKTAIRLKKAEALESSPIDEVTYKPKSKLNIIEATLIGNKIKLIIGVARNFSYDDLTATLNFQEGLKKSYPAIQDANQANCFFVEITEDIIYRLNHSSTLIQIEAIKGGKRIATSNNVLVINLLDIQTGKSLRHERRIKEAQKGINEFFAALQDILRQGDEEYFKIFLTFCDIPLIDAAGPFRLPKPRQPWEPGTGMKQLGRRNLEIFRELHDLVISFVDRHLKKLMKHVIYGGINGIPNFVHILSAAGGVLTTQIERALHGFEATSEAMASDEWHDYREKFDLYYLKFEELIKCLCDEYMPRMIKDYNISQIKEIISSDIAQVNNIYSIMVDFRERIELIRSSKLKIKNEYGFEMSRAPYFPDNIFNEDQWANFVSDIGDKLKNLNKVIALKERNESSLKQ